VPLPHKIWNEAAAAAAASARQPHSWQIHAHSASSQLIMQPAYGVKFQGLNNSTVCQNTTGMQQYTWEQDCNASSKV
jgi:hypothetical protein